MSRPRRITLSTDRHGRTIAWIGDGLWRGRYSLAKARAEIAAGTSVLWADDRTDDTTAN